MAFIVDRDTKAGVFVDIDSSEIAEHLMNPNNMIWFDFYQPNYNWIQQKLRIPKRLITGCLEDGSYCESLKGMFLLKVIALNPDQGNVGELVWLKIIVGERVILTLRDAAVDAIETKQFDNDKIAAKLSKGTDHLLCYFLSRLIKDYYLVLEKLQNESDAFQIEHIGNFNPYDKIYDLSNRITLYPQLFTEQLLVLQELINQANPLVKKSSRVYLSGCVQRIRSIRFALISLEKSLTVFLKVQSIHSLFHSHKKLQTTIIVSALILILWTAALLVFF